MITVSITDSDRGRVAILEIDEDPGTVDNPELGGYIVKMQVDRGDSIGIHRAYVSDWPKNAVNSIGLLKAALNQFDEDDLTYEVQDDGDGDADKQSSTDGERQALVSPFVAGELYRALQAFPGGEGGLRNHRPALRSRQPVEHVEDDRG